MKKTINRDKSTMTLKEFINERWCYAGVFDGSLLHAAVCAGDLNLVKKAIEFGADLNKTYSGGPTALFLAKDLDIAKELISAGADPNMSTNGNNIPVTGLYQDTYMAVEKHRETLEYLISVSDIDLPGAMGYTLLLALIENKEDDYEFFKLVLDNTKDLNKLFYGETLLFDAAKHIENENIFLLLAQSGIDLYQRNEDGLDFYDYCHANIQRIIEEKMPEFIERREMLRSFKK